MDYSKEFEAAREWADTAHRFQLEIINALERLAAETDKDPGELAQMLNMGGMHGFLQPVMMRYHERQQQRFMAMQQAPAQAHAAAPKPEPPAES